jgi:predicted AAA+ superfamily ATPase
MKREEILRILLDWNFWKKNLESGIERNEYVDKALRFLQPNMIVSLIGVRRSGKSVLMRQIAKKLMESGIANKNEILIVNFEDKRIVERDLKLIDDFFNAYMEEMRPLRKPIVFLDEITKIPRWEKWVRTMHELNKAKILISGSTSQLTKGELATLLTGRHIDIIVFPLSFNEFLQFKNIQIKDKLEALAKESEIKALLREYIRFGGFPEVVLTKDEEVKRTILLTYFDDIIEKDVVERYKIRKTEKLKMLAKFYLSNISSPTTFSSLEQFLNMNSVTIEKFSYLLEEAFLIFFAKIFHPSVKKQEKVARKVYCIDVGLSNAIGFKIEESIGKLMENVVAIELKRRNPLLEIYYWKEYGKAEGKEVDFVVRENFIVKQLIQVTYASNRNEVEKREIEALIKASGLLKCNDLLVITWNYEDVVEISDKKIKFVPLWKWLLNL